MLGKGGVPGMKRKGGGGGHSRCRMERGASVPTATLGSSGVKRK